MRLAVCIPTYNRHLAELAKCLESFDAQTVSPWGVFVSASSITTDAEKGAIEALLQAKRPYPLKILSTSEKHLAGGNRNRAAAAAVEAGATHLSFLDSDDLANPRRIDYIQKGFERGAEAVMTTISYSETTITSEPDFVDNCVFLEPENYISPDGSYQGVFYRAHFIDSNEVERPTCFAHVSVKSEIWQAYPFDTLAMAWEDAKFISQIVKARYRFCLILAPLSVYTAVMDNNYSKKLDDMKVDLSEIRSKAESLSSS